MDPLTRNVPTHWRIAEPARVLSALVLFSVVLQSCGVFSKVDKSSAKNGQFDVTQWASIAVIRPDAAFSASGEDTLLAEPISVAPLPDGRFYVLDGSGPRLHLFDFFGQPQSVTGDYSVGTGGMRNPRFVRTDGVSRVWVSDADNHRIQVFDRELNYLESFLPPYPMLELPRGRLSGLASAPWPNGDLYCADVGNDYVFRFDVTGHFVSIIGDSVIGPGSLDKPEGLAVDNSGRVFVCDSGNHRIAVFESSGVFVHSIGDNDLIDPVSIALTDKGAVLVCDRGINSVMVYTMGGRFLAEWDGATLIPGGFHNPVDIAYADSLLYVVNSGSLGILVLRDEGRNQ